MRSSNGMGPEFSLAVRGFRGVVERLCGVVREFYGMVFDLTAWC